MTIRELFDAYLATREGELSPLTLDTIRDTGAAIADALKGITVARVTEKSAHDAKPVLLQRAKATTVCKWLSHTRQVWTWAEATGNAKSNPWKSLTVYARDRDKPAPELPSDLIWSIVEKAPPDVGCALALCRWAGLRRQEALSLSWSDVSDGKIRVVPREGEATTKQHTRTIPITKYLGKALELARGLEHPTGWLRHGNAPREAIKAIRVAGHEPWERIFQSLRANCESEWLAAGLPVFDVAKWMGHSPQVAFKHYHMVTSASEERLRAL